MTAELYAAVALAIAIVGGLLGGWLTHTVDNTGYARLQVQFADYKTQHAQEVAAAQTAVREELQKEIDQMHADAQANAKVIDDLKVRNAETAAQHDSDAAYLRRVLNSPGKGCPATAGDQVPASPVQPGAAGASGTGSTQEVAIDLCADTKAEDQRNADRLDSLISEIHRQE